MLFGVADRDFRGGVGQKILNLRRRVAGVERQKHAARHHRADIKLQRLQRLVDLHRDAVARLDAQPDQRRRHPLGPGEERAIGDGFACAGAGEQGVLAPLR